MKLKIKRLWVVLLAFVVLLFASCDQKKPEDGYLNDEQVLEIVKGFSATADYTKYSYSGTLNFLGFSDDLIPNEKACQVFKEIDFNQVDYIIVSYGLNDYFSDIPIHPQEYYDLTSFVGALRHGVRKLQKKYPQAQIILTSPTYTEWFQGDRTFELGEYVEAARGVSAEYETHFRLY